MFGIPSPTLILSAALAFILSTGGAYFWGSHEGHKSEKLVWEAAIAKQGQEAETALIAANKLSADKDNANIVSALTVEEKHGQEIAAINADVDHYSLRYADSLRRIAQCRPGGGGQLPAAAVNSNQPQIAPAGSPDRLFEDAGQRLSVVGGNCNKLAATVRECVAWAAKVGR